MLNLKRTNARQFDTAQQLELLGKTSAFLAEAYPGADVVTHRQKVESRLDAGPILSELDGTGGNESRGKTSTQ